MTGSPDTFGLVGRLVDNTYRVLRQVGEGGFGVVYLAQDEVLRVDVALKCLKIPPHFTAEVQSQFLGKFVEEARLLAKLSHPSIVRIYRFGGIPTAGGQIPYLALEWLSGRDLENDLAQRRAKGALYSEQEAVGLMLPVIEAIALAHRRGVAHRDLKPANIFLLEEDGRVLPKVLDFGIAKVMQEGEATTQYTTKTSSGFSAFSSTYGAPEQFHSKRHGPSGPWTDVHAIGLILADLVTGRAGFGDDHAECLLACLGPERPTPRSLGVRVSDGFDAVIAKALALQPQDRYRDARELESALRELSTGAAPRTPNETPVPAVATRFVTPAVPATDRAPAVPPPPVRVSSGKHTSFGRWPSIVVGSLVLAGAGASGILAWRALYNPGPPPADRSAKDPSSSSTGAAEAARLSAEASTTSPEDSGANPSNPSDAGAAVASASGDVAQGSLPTASAAPLVLTKGSWERTIPLGQWKNFTARVTRGGQPVPNAHVAWRTPALGPRTYIGTTDANGITSATQLYTSYKPGAFVQVAAIVPSSWSGGQWSNGAVPTEGAPVTFNYTQEDAAPTSGKTPSYYSCTNTSECLPGNLCIDNHDNSFYCKPMCSSDTDCARNSFGAVVCKTIRGNANAAAIGRKICLRPDDP